ncbi:hypothetical protein PBY51_004520 [Eleginops maclovinus]|uniref:Uncharacterized protein n=1 Tax=Eleginops maclovinus TaxID=56733 RepID=A0AAN7Y072_ELEMC|nr:hypothetical protein PBY51_004520 [Eleginops maclovinus]
MRRACDAQVSSAESLPHLSPRPICCLHAQRRGVTAGHYDSADDHQVLKQYATKNSVHLKCLSARHITSQGSKRLSQDVSGFPLPDDGFG